MFPFLLIHPKIVLQPLFTDTVISRKKIIPLYTGSPVPIMLRSFGNKLFFRHARPDHTEVGKAYEKSASDSLSFSSIRDNREASLSMTNNPCASASRQGNFIESRLCYSTPTLSDSSYIRTSYILPFVIDMLINN